jgi:hypothetical protein
VQVVEVVGVAVFELLLHQYLPHMPGLDVHYLEDRSDSVVIDELAELVAVGQCCVFDEGAVEFLVLVHGDGPEVVVQSQSFPYFEPYSLGDAVVEVVIF